ncbi:MAG: hypothetical protein ABI562_00805 [Chloroflexota bacterium]
MRTRWIIAVVLILIGAVWMAQGLGFIKGSGFMDGNTIWAVIGAGLAIAGLVIGWTAFRARSHA